MSNYLVSITCITFNHVKYLKKCLNGFLMQKTNFPFEIIIHDDASTDGTTEIIKKYKKKYPNLIQPIYQTQNKYSKGYKIAHEFVYPKAQGKYIAICEGDDYWTDPYKLQKQVDFLENNPDYNICGTMVKAIDEKGIEHPHNSRKTGEIILDDILRRNQFATCSVVFRNHLVKYPYFKNSNKYFTGDWQLWAALLSKGKGYNLKDITAQYNIHTAGAVSGRNLTKTLHDKLNDRLLMIENFPDKKKIIKSYGMRIILHYFKNTLKGKFPYLKSLLGNKKIIFKFILS